MKRYCLDTSGFSTPHEQMPEDVPFFASVWECVIACIESGAIATTEELYSKELCRLTGRVGECIRDCKQQMVLDVGDSSWDALGYIRHYDRMRKVHHDWIAEYAFKNPSKTLGLVDLTGIALAKTLTLPLVSSESSAGDSPKHKRIPDICTLEGVIPYTFNDFLKLEGGAL